MWIHICKDVINTEKIKSKLTGFSTELILPKILIQQGLDLGGFKLLIIDIVTGVLHCLTE